MINRNFLRRAKRLFERKAVVLMYHRVARIPADPWELAVQPEHFEQHLAVLTKQFHVVSVNELVEQLHQRTIRKNCVCITFDDGYSDNYVNAKPLLEKYKCPASFFITTQFINRKQLFWWDELQHILLDTYFLPAVFSLTINGEAFQFDLKEDAILTELKRRWQQAWIAPHNPPNRRCELYLQIWRMVKPLPEKELQLALDKIRLWAGGLTGTYYLDMPMSQMQLSNLSTHPLFAIGLHTVAHLALSNHSPEVQSQQIVSSRHSLEQICNRPGNILTYPYGDYNDTTIDVVRKERLDAAFTTDPRVVTKRSDIYRLGRFQVKNWNGAAFEKQLSTWLKKST
jgi:peptidoglycan/xylan/chitin deacetylase (PgdA/CDA1 family)